MSMSQEEIEALMNGLDEPAPSEPETPPLEEAEDESAEMSADDIENLIASTQGDEEEPSSEENDIDDLLAQLDDADSQDDVEPQVQEEVEEEKIEEVTSEIPEETVEESEDVDTSDIDALLAGIDGVSEDEPSEPKEDADSEAIGRAWTSDKVDQGVFPSPVEPDTKVVGQLSQVAKDSEDKAGEIFDVLSLILDENNEIQKNSKQLDEFVEGQIKLLATLTEKFPNISMFKEQLDMATAIKDKGKDSNQRIDNMNMKIFEAMEQMQFFDINRQKIERVMSVIKKLSTYLNNLFEDDGDYQDVQIAKHIHGDSTDGTVEGEDLDALIAEFNK